jgi:hypothetical protein
MTTRLLSAEDIYDVYGLERINSIPNLDPEDTALLTFRLHEIRGFYLSACKSRIRAEAQYLGVKLTGDGFSFTQVLDEIKRNIGKAMEQNAEKMMRGGSFNLMHHILSAHQAAGADLKGIDTSRFGLTTQTKPTQKDVDPNWFMDTKKHGGRVWEDPRWAEAGGLVGAEDVVHEVEGAAAHHFFGVLLHGFADVPFDLVQDLGEGEAVPGEFDAEVLGFGPDAGFAGR